MLVVCGRCDTEYEFDDALLSERGTTVKCTNCGYQFRVRPPRGVRPTDERWVVRKLSGTEQVFGSLRDLRKAIDDRLVSVEDQLSRDGGPFRPISLVAELAALFKRTAPAPLPHGQTLMGVGQGVARAPLPAAPLVPGRTPAAAGQVAPRAGAPLVPPAAPPRPPQASYPSVPGAAGNSSVPPAARVSRRPGVSPPMVTGPSSPPGAALPERATDRPGANPTAPAPAGGLGASPGASGSSEPSPGVSQRPTRLASLPVPRPNAPSAVPLPGRVSAGPVATKPALGVPPAPGAFGSTLPSGTSGARPGPSAPMVPVAVAPLHGKGAQVGGSFPPTRRSEPSDRPTPLISDGTYESFASKDSAAQGGNPAPFPVLLEQASDEEETVVWGAANPLPRELLDAAAAVSSPPEAGAAPNTPRVQAAASNTSGATPAAQGASGAGFGLMNNPEQLARAAHVPPQQTLQGQPPAPNFASFAPAPVTAAVPNLVATLAAPAPAGSTPAGSTPVPGTAAGHAAQAEPTASPNPAEQRSPFARPPREVLFASVPPSTVPHLPLDQSAPAHLAASDQYTSAAPARRAGGLRWVIALVVLGGLGLLAGTVGKDYLAQFIRSKPQPSAPGPATGALEQADRALLEGQLSTAQAKLAEARSSGAASSDVLQTTGRLAVVQADMEWLRLQLLPTDDARRAGAERALGEHVREIQNTLGVLEAQAGAETKASLLQIELLGLQGRLPAAREQVQRAALDPSEPHVAFALARLDLNEAEPTWASVLGRLRTAASAERGLGRAQSALVFALLRSGDVAGAQQELAKLEQASPAHPLLPELKAWLASKAGNLAAAAASALPSAGAAPSPAHDVVDAPSNGADSVTHAGARQLLEEAAAARASGDLAGARAKYQQALNLSPGNLAVLTGLGGVARLEGKYQEAKGYYDQVLERNPDYPAALVGGADVRWLMGNRDAAVLLYGKIPAGSSFHSHAQRRIAEARGGAAPGAPGAGAPGGSPAPTAAAPGSPPDQPSAAEPKPEAEPEKPSDQLEEKAPDEKAPAAPPAGDKPAADKPVSGEATPKPAPEDEPQ